MIISLPLNISFSTHPCHAWILLWRILDWSNSNISYLYCSAGSRSRTRTSKETEYRLSLTAGHCCGVLFVGLGFLFIFIQIFSYFQRTFKGFLTVVLIFIPQKKYGFIWSTICIFGAQFSRIFYWKKNKLESKCSNKQNTRKKHVVRPTK